MSKLSKFLLKNGTLITDCATGSSYYKVADQKVRVSNHLPGSKNLSDLIIFVPENSKKQYIIAITGKIYIHNSYTSLRIFLENWILMAKVFEANYNFQLARQNALENKLTALRKTTKKGDNTNTLNLNQFTQGQRNTIQMFLKQNNLNKVS